MKAKSSPLVSVTGHQCPHLEQRQLIDEVTKRYSLLVKRVVFPCGEKDSAVKVNALYWMTVSSWDESECV